MNKLSPHVLVVFAVGIAGCGERAPDQVLTGRVTDGFPSLVRDVRVIEDGDVLARSPIVSDGTFSLSVPAGTGLALQLIGTGKTQLVFPRQDAGIARTFTIRAGGAPFDLGAIRFVGPEHEAGCEDGVEDDLDDDLEDEGDAVAEHSFPADGCSEDVLEDDLDDDEDDIRAP